MTGSGPHVRLDVPHQNGCNNQLIAIDPEWLAEHRPGVPILQMRDARGYRRAGGWYHWLALICNTMDCPAVALVRCDDIERLATEALESRPTRKVRSRNPAGGR